MLYFDYCKPLLPKTDFLLAYRNLILMSEAAVLAGSGFSMAGSTEYVRWENKDGPKYELV